MCQIDNAMTTGTTGGFQKGESSLSNARKLKKAQDVLQDNTGHLALLDTMRTYFLWNKHEWNVKDAAPDVFDHWIRQFVDEIVNVDTATWEIFHRWNIINAVIDGQFLIVRKRGDGTLLVEAKASASEPIPEAKASELTSDKVVLSAIEADGGQTA
jgi:hypothetical protein